MKNQKTLLPLVLLTLAISACKVNPTTDYEKDMQKTIDENKKKQDEIYNNLGKALEVGGQPGQIKVAGVIVKDNAETDIRITILSHCGMSKDGTEAMIQESQKPLLKTTPASDMVAGIKERKNLVSFGCPQETVQEHAKENSLNVTTKSEVEDVPIYVANTIILCGKLDFSDLSFVSFVADQIILENVQIERLNFLNGWIGLTSNKLTILGENKIESKGIDTSMPIFAAPGIDLTVYEEISSDESGKLLLTSKGSNYVAPAK